MTKYPSWAAVAERLLRYDNAAILSSLRLERPIDDQKRIEREVDETFQALVEAVEPDEVAGPYVQRWRDAAARLSAALEADRKRQQACQPLSTEAFNEMQLCFLDETAARAAFLAVVRARLKHLGPWRNLP